MAEPLTAKYRPRAFEDVVGQRLTAVVLQQMVKNGSIPKGLLFGGPRGTGKTSVARILAMALNPNEAESILAGTSLAVLEIDSASHGSVEDVRELVRQLGFSVGAGVTRVIIFDEAHAITRDGFNALLKTLEEPPEHVVFVLVTTEPQKIPPTVLSRLMEFEFPRVSPADLLARVQYIAALEQIEISQDLAVKIVESADGSVRDAVKYLDFVHRAEVTTVEQYIELTGQKDYGPLLLAALLTNDHAKIFAVYDKLILETGDPRTISTALSDVITDIFILKAGGHVTAAGKALDYRIKLAQMVQTDLLYAAVSILWDLKTKVRQVENQRAALATALILVADKLSDGKTPISETPTSKPSAEVESGSEARPLTMAELQQS